MKKAFIAFGHDETAHLELETFLRSLNLKPILLVDQDDLGMTIVEKFEHYAMSCDVAFILLTPDDSVLSNGNGSDCWRARQNVILELGWFMRHLTRRKVLIIYKDSIEMPSNILGVICLRYSDSIFEVGDKIRQRLVTIGII